MASTVLLNNTVGFKINTTGVTYVDLSSYLTNATLSVIYDSLEISAMGDTAHKYTAGLQAGTLAITLLNDPTASTGSIAILNSLVGTTALCKMVQTQTGGTATVSTTNALYSFSIFLDTITPINGGPSVISEQVLTFKLNSGVTIAYTGTY